MFEFSSFALQDCFVASTDVTSCGASAIWLSSLSSISCKLDQKGGRPCCSVFMLLVFVCFSLAFIFFDRRRCFSAKVSSIDSLRSLERRRGVCGNRGEHDEWENCEEVDWDEKCEDEKEADGGEFEFEAGDLGFNGFCGH